MTAMRGEPDADILAELTAPRGKLTKAPAVDPVLGLTQPAARVARAQTPAVEEERPERKEKVGGWYGYPSNLARIRAAWFHTQTEEDGWPSLSEMTEQLLLREAQRLEEVHNGGEPFPAVPAGKVRHSRRTP